MPLLKVKDHEHNTDVWIHTDHIVRIEPVGGGFCNVKLSDAEELKVTEDDVSALVAASGGK